MNFHIVQKRREKFNEEERKQLHDIAHRKQPTQINLSSDVIIVDFVNPKDTIV